MKLSSLSKFHDLGLLVLRVALGAFYFYVHGLPKLLGGAPLWHKVGASMTHMGIHFYPVFWGFMAACTESIGPLLLIIGLFFRPTCMLLTFVMVVAATMQLHSGDGLKTASHAIEMGILFFSLIFIGPGKYSID